VNTLHFGQKAKHVKTTVNINEIKSSPEIDMENATKLIAELREKVRQFEERMLQPEENRMEVDFV
jgi:Holliday junction resolvasome RuvABC DNA-binding subunit